MLKIDLFNKSADIAEITAAIHDDTFKFGSKLYVKYLAKNFAEGIVVGAVLGLATVGALVLIADALTPSTEEETE